MAFNVCQSVAPHFGMCGKVRLGGVLQGGGKEGTALTADCKLYGLWGEGMHWATWQVITNISSTKCHSWLFSLYSPRSFLKEEYLTSTPWLLWGIFLSPLHSIRILSHPVPKVVLIHCLEFPEDTCFSLWTLTKYLITSIVLRRQWQVHWNTSDISS